MKMTKFERSGFIIETDSGYRLALDIGNKTPVLKLEGMSVDAMLSSHMHGDHFSLEQIKKLNPKKLYLSNECIEAMGEDNLNNDITTIRAGTEILIGDIALNIFNVDHGPHASYPLTENFGFLLNVDGQTIYFAGDMFYPSGIDVSLLEVDYALLPVGTTYTFGPVEAFHFAKQFKKIGKIITMHYDIKPGSQDRFFELARGIFEVE